MTARKFENDDIIYARVYSPKQNSISYRFAKVIKNTPILNYRIKLYTTEIGDIVISEKDHKKIRVSIGSPTDITKLVDCDGFHLEGATDGVQYEKYNGEECFDEWCI